MKLKRKYLIVGAGARGMLFYAASIMKDFGDVAEIAGLCDLNLKRMEKESRRLGITAPLFTDLREALSETHPDSVICATRDSIHHEVILTALEGGSDVICEKPMTIDDQKVRAILAAEKRTGRKVTVTFNYRYGTAPTEIKKAIQEGTIGKPYSIDFNWYLDCIHGADYFRRWHAHMKDSGGLFVHKATHHFDLANWLLESRPETVFAIGTRNCFGPGKREPHGERCRTCKNACEFYWDLDSDEWQKSIYLETEDDGDRYVRDACVFREDIDIYDTMAVAVRYENGAQLSYSLHAGLPYEGYRLAINGTRGRIDFTDFETGPNHVPGGWTFEITRPFSQTTGKEVRFVPEAGGGHGGGDPLLLEHLFRGGGENDPYGRPASSMDGAMSVLVGVAANRSIATGGPVRIATLLEGERGIY